jgi:integrase
MPWAVRDEKRYAVRSRQYASRYDQRAEESQASAPLHTPLSQAHLRLGPASDGVPAPYVQEQLRHATIELTVSTYGRWLKKKAPGALDRLDSIPVNFVAASVSGSRTGVCTELTDRIDFATA